jgi:hypothetical protein
MLQTTAPQAPEALGPYTSLVVELMYKSPLLPVPLPGAPGATVNCGEYPAGPMAPWIPCGPVNPMTPCDPVAPVGPRRFMVTEPHVVVLGPYTLPVAESRYRSVALPRPIAGAPAPTHQ